MYDIIHIVAHCDNNAFPILIVSLLQM